MFIRSLQVLLYIFHCLRLQAKPWLFFQLNADYFNDRKGIFSKLDIDQLIPMRWRLSQYKDTGVEAPENFPVFLKPEWGQNSAGVCRIGSQVQLDQARKARGNTDVPFMIQEAAKGQREFEVYLVPDPATGSFSVLSVTETTNSSGEILPVNGILNRETGYKDVTVNLSVEQQQRLWENLKQVGNFRVSRFGIRANELSDLVEGDFQIFEINLFIPMPLVLLADNVSFIQKIKHLNHITISFARVTEALPKAVKRKSVFFRKMVAVRQNRRAGLNSSGTFTPSSSPITSSAKTSVALQDVPFHKGTSL